MKTTLLQVRLDGNGNGWSDWDPGFGRDPVPVGVTLLGPSPPDDNSYWDDQADITLAAQPRAGRLRVTARHGPPGVTINAWVSCA